MTLQENQWPNFAAANDVVRPRLSDRTYKRSGATSVSVYGNENLLWVIELPSQQAANDLMVDIYYGEYDGG